MVTNLNHIWTTALPKPCIFIKKAFGEGRVISNKVYYVS
jgi:hypothetical protein